MATSREVKLAGNLGPGDWAARVKELQAKPSVDLWKRTGQDYLVDRIEH